MDELGIDERYRSATRCTLYTLEMHLRYLHEIKGEDELHTHYELIGFDAKRLHLLLALHCGRYPDPAAVIEVMLLHVRQDAEPRSAKLPEAAMERLRSWQPLAPDAALAGARLAPDDAHPALMGGATLNRLLNPGRIALVGAGIWTDAVAAGRAHAGL